MNANSNTENQLPAGWAEAKIGELIDPKGVFIDGDWVETKDQDPNGDVRLVQLADVGDGTYRDRSSRFLTSEKARELDCTFLKVGDVLIARMPDPLGRACIFPGDSKNSVTVVDVCVVRTGALGANHRWLVWAVNSPQFRNEISELQSGSTRKRISRGNLATLFMPIPPLAEQARIAQEIEKQITRLEAGVVALKRVQANLKRYRAAVLKAAVEGRLVPTAAELARREGRSYEPASELLKRILAEHRARWEADHLAKMQTAGKPRKDDKWKGDYKEPSAPDLPNLPQLPEGWAWASPEQLRATDDYALAIGPFGSNLKVNDYSESGVPLIFVRNIRRQSFSGPDTKYVSHEKANELRPHWIRPGDVLVTKMGDPPGDACTYPPALPTAIITADCLKITFSKELPIPQFFVAAINSKLVQTQILSITQGVAQKKVSLDRFRTIGLPLAPLPEQSRIVAEVERRLSVIDELEMQVEANLKRAERLRQAILKRAFEGKLVPQDPNDEPASMLLERIRAERETVGVPLVGTLKFQDHNPGTGRAGTRPAPKARSGRNRPRGGT